MRSIVIIIGLLLSVDAAFTQKPLSKAAITDFAAVCWYNYRYGNVNFRATMNTYLPYSLPEVAELMENLDTNTKGREEVFNLFYRIAGNYESLFRSLYGLNLSASVSKEIAAYIIEKNDKPKVAEEDTIDGQPIKIFDGGGYSYEYVENMQPSKAEKFFQGKKSFGGHFHDVYVATISGAKIKITEPANADSVLLDGFVKDGRIYEKSGKESKFRYKNKVLYYHGQPKQWYLFWELKGE